MLTRCPACATHFRITPAQIKVRAGSVRCGTCQHVFNALDSLIEASVAAVAPPPAESTPSGLAALPLDIDLGSNWGGEAPIETTAVSPASTFGIEEDAANAILIPGPEVCEPSSEEPAEIADTADSDVTETNEATEAETESFPGDWNETFPEPPPPPRRWPWVAGSLIALAAIVLQAVLAFRTELAVMWPQARPALLELCAAAGCDVGLPAKVALVGIEASDLHPDSEHKGRLMLSATLKNRAPFAQAYPHLELTLTDTDDKAVARKVLAPADFLPTGTSISQGMPTGADIVVAVGIDSGGLAASGYRLYLFYP